MFSSFLVFCRRLGGIWCDFTHLEKLFCNLSFISLILTFNLTFPLTLFLSLDQSPVENSITIQIRSKLSHSTIHFRNWYIDTFGQCFKERKKENWYFIQLYPNNLTKTVSLNGWVQATSYPKVDLCKLTSFFFLIFIFDHMMYQFHAF